MLSNRINKQIWNLKNIRSACMRGEWCVQEGNAKAFLPAECDDPLNKVECEMYCSYSSRCHARVCQRVDHLYGPCVCIAQWKGFLMVHFECGTRYLSDQLGVIIRVCVCMSISCSTMSFSSLSVLCSFLPRVQWQWHSFTTCLGYPMPSNLI